MNARDAIRSGLKLAARICESYLEDLSDEDMMQRPAPGCNHITWQLGHLIVSEHRIIQQAVPGSMPPLPENFAERYEKQTAGIDDASKFDDKATLLDVYRQQRTATLAALQGVSEHDLDDPMPQPIADYAATVGDAFAMQASHWTMHAGQWVIVRRQLGREPLF